MSIWCTKGKDTMTTESKIWRKKGSWPSTSGPPQQTTGPTTTTIKEWDYCAGLSEGEPVCPAGSVGIQPWGELDNSYQSAPTLTILKYTENENDPELHYWATYYVIEKVTSTFKHKEIINQYVCIPTKFLAEIGEVFTGTGHSFSAEAAEDRSPALKSS
jgi:hypothetical protein